MSNKIFQFINECKTELKDKTTWPTKDQVMSTTVTVIVAIVICAVSFYLVDLIVGSIVHVLTVTHAKEVRNYVGPLTYIGLLILMVVGVVLGNQIKKRISKY